MHFLCLICRKALKDDQAVEVTHCGHLFHTGCLQRWHDRSDSCPDCNVRIIHGLLTTVQLRRDDRSSRENPEYLLKMLHVSDIQVAKLRQLLKGYTEMKEQLATETANRNLIAKKLESEQNRRLTAENNYLYAANKLKHANQELSRKKQQLKTLHAQKPYKKCATTQTCMMLATTVEQKPPPSKTRVIKLPMASFENIPQLKKRPGISANANRRQPVSDLSHVIEMMRDPVVNERVMLSHSIADVSIDLDQPLKVQPWSPITKKGRRDKAIGGGLSGGVYRI